MTDEQVTHPGRGLPRRVCVKGMREIDATVVVTVVQGSVWMSIMPPFTWEAIMEPGKVDEVIRTLQLARIDAERMGAALRGPRGGTTVIREITKGPGSQ